MGLLLVPLGLVRLPHGRLTSAALILVVTLAIAWVTFADILLIVVALVLASVLLAWPRTGTAAGDAAGG